MPKIFEQNQKLNIVEYGDDTKDFDLNALQNRVIGCVKGLLKSE